jgi:hypothetical protein
MMTAGAALAWYFGGILLLAGLVLCWVLRWRP